MIKNSGIPLFQYRGIPVGLDYSWFIIFFLVVATLGAYFFPENYPDLPNTLVWLYSLTAAILFFASILLHEFAHAIVAQARGIKISRIILFVFGGLAQMEEEPNKAKTEFEIAVAGPVLSAVLGVLFLGLAWILEPYIDEGLHGVFWYIGYINLILVAFNMVPGFPLDGGRILRAAIWHRTGKLDKATRIVSNIGQGFAFALMGIGLLGILGGAFIAGIFWIFIGLFLQQSAKSGYQMVVMKKGLSHVPVKQIMTDDPKVVSPELLLDELVMEYFFKNKYSSFPILENDVFLGLIEINQVKQVPREKWSEVKVREVMNHKDDLSIITPETDSYVVLMEMMNKQIGRMPVIDNSGKLVGIVSRKDILQFLNLRENLLE